MNVSDQTRQTFVTSLGPFCDRSSMFVHRPKNVRSPNTSQVQAFQNNLWAYLWQFSYWLICFFFFKLMVIHAWRCDFVKLLSRFICKFAISLHTFLCVTFHVIRPRRYCFCIRFPWSSERYVLQQYRYFFDTLWVQTQIYMVKKWCRFSQVNVFHENFQVGSMLPVWYRPHTLIRIVLLLGWQRNIPSLKLFPSHTSIGFSKIAFPIIVLPEDDRTDSFREERLGLPYWTMILANCVVVDESKCLDIPNLEF